MIVLGLHFGHDAGVAVLVDGKIISCVIRERQTRVKHAMTLDIQTIDKALKDAGVNVNQVDLCAITSTQGIELIVDDPKGLSISLTDCASNNSFTCRTSMNKLPTLHGSAFSTLFNKEFFSSVDVFSKNLFSKIFPEFESFKGKEKQFCGWIDDFVTDELWEPPKVMENLSSSLLSSEVRSEFLRYGFHYPAEITLQGCRLPAFFIQHHACHAASSYYQSGFYNAAIFVQDGGRGDGYDSGMFYSADGNRIYPIAPHHSIIGFLYNEVAFLMNLGELAAGKLMGLAAYGKPVFYDGKFLGNYNDLVKLAQAKDMYEIGEYWVVHCLTLAKDMGYDIEPFGDVARMTAPINVDIAASTQKLFEENTRALVEILYNYLKQNKMSVDQLCLSGGNALNCPTNSRIYREGPFRRVFVEPGCDDSGLAIGAVLYCYFNLLDHPLPKKHISHFASPFLGPQVEESDILSAVEYFKKQVHYEKISDWAIDAARELEKNHIIAWFCGRSEIGPRALGHRSILADARDAKNWERVNKIKSREPWRPFAPVVLESEAKKWFSDSPFPSPYMLFNAVVKSKEIPAVTHVDGTARIQTVNKSNGDFYDLLNEFFQLTAVPILLNTSFNGPGEPIVETPMDAMNFFVNSELDALYIDSYKITRNRSSRRRKAKKPVESPITSPINAQAFMVDFKVRQYEKSEIQHYRATPELIVEGYKGYNLIAFQNHFFGIRQSIGEVNLFKDVSSIIRSALPDDIIISRSFSQLRDDIDGISTAQRLRQEAAIANEQAAARIGAVESNQESLDGLVKRMVEQMAAERHAADQALDKLRQESSIASEQMAARIGAVESNQENLDGLVKGMVEQMAAERHAADQALDKLRQEAAIANEQAAARIGAVESGQEKLDGLVKSMAEQMAAERQAADQALDKLRQEAAIASEQAAARIGSVETNQGNLDGLIKRMAEQIANERQTADQALDKLRREAAIASEQAAARIGMLESDLTRLIKRIDEQEQQIHLLQRSWSVRFTDVFRRRSRVSNEDKK